LLLDYTTNITCVNGSRTLVNDTHKGELSRSTTVDVKDGDAIVCTITNTRQTGTVTLVKSVTNDSGGNLGSNDFGLTVDGAAATSNQAVTVNTGTHTINEATVSGYRFVSITGTGCPATLGGTVTVTSGQNVTCTITNDDIAPKLTLVKQVSGGAAIATDWTLSATPSEGQSISGAGGVSGATARAGLQYTLAESTGPAGYSAGNWSCNGGVLSGNKLTLALAEQVTCTITNTRDTGTLTVNKMINPADDGGLFNLLIKGPTNNTKNDQTSGGSTGKQTVDSGSYTVEEAAGTGTSLTAYHAEYVCKNGETTMASGNATVSDSFTVSKGVNVICTFTNTKYASISGYKYEVNAGATTGTQGSPDWTISLLLDGQPINTPQVTDANGHYSFDKLLPGIYSLAETFKDGWTQIFNPGDVTLTAGQSSTGNDFGNFENGSISGFKWNDVNGNGSYDNEPKLADWTIFIDADGDGSWGQNELKTTTGAQGGYSFTNLAPGTYKVCEVQQTGWTQTYPGNNSCQSVDIDVSGETETANFGNQGRGTIKVEKNVDTDGDGNVDEWNVANWNWNIDGNGGYDTGSKQTVAAGDYTVAEVQKAGYHVTASNCGDEESTSASESKNVTVSAGEDIVCKFTNTRDTGYITVNKTLYPSDDSGLFNLQINGQTAGTGANVGHGGTTSRVRVPTGTFTVGETAGTDTDLGDYYSTYYCDNEVGGEGVESDSFTIGKGDTITCGFYNTKFASVSITKDARPDSSQPFTFHFGQIVQEESLTNLSNLDEDTSFTLTDDGSAIANTQQFNKLRTGTYYVSEDALDGWDLKDIDCGDVRLQKGDGTVYFTLEAGQNMDCTFTNTKRASITIVEDSQPDANQAFNFGTNVNGVPDTFSLTDNGTTSPKQQFVNVKPGTYTFTEDPATGWDLKSIDCGVGVTFSRSGSTITVTVAAGDNVTCTFTNKKVEAGLVLGAVTVAQNPTPTVKAAELANTGDNIVAILVTASSALTLALLFTVATRKQSNI
jgi:hypothetical protein